MTQYADNSLLTAVKAVGTGYPLRGHLRIKTATDGPDFKPDGIPDILVRAINNDNEHFLHIYKNLRGMKPVNYVYPGIGWESSANYFTKYFEYDRGAL